MQYCRVMQYSLKRTRKDSRSYKCRLLRFNISVLSRDIQLNSAELSHLHNAETFCGVASRLKRDGW